MTWPNFYLDLWPWPLSFDMMVKLSQSYIPLYVLLRGVYGQNLAKLQGTCKAHVQCFYPAHHMQRPTEEFWHNHNFLRAPCDCRFAFSLQGTCSKKECYPWDLALVASLEWGVKGSRRNVTSEQVRETYLCVTFHLRSPCQVRFKWVQLTWLVLVKYVRRLGCKRDSMGARTRCTAHGTSTRVLKVSCSNFGGSVRVQLRELI
jgi:hypothetical protein